MKQKEHLIKSKSNVSQEQVRSWVEETLELEAQVPSRISLHFLWPLPLRHLQPFSLLIAEEAGHGHQWPPMLHPPPNQAKK